MTTRDDWRDALAATPQCIAIERLGETLTDAEREHVATCARCQAEVALFHEFTSAASTPDETRDGQWIANELHRRLDGASNVRAFERPRRRAPQFAWAAAAMVALAVGTGYWLENREPSIGTAGSLGVYRSARVEALAPIGDVAQAPRELRWKAVDGATSYVVTLSEVDHTELWRGETEATRIVLPVDVAARCAPGKTLLWDVAARRGSDVLASSGAQRFRVALQSPRRNVP